MADVTATVHASDFSAADLLAMIAFSEPPAGQKVFDKLPDVTRQTLNRRHRVRSTRRSGPAQPDDPGIAQKGRQSLSRPRRGEGTDGVRRCAVHLHFRVLPWSEINVIGRMAPMKGI
jgi:hypothetical protein